MLPADLTPEEQAHELLRIACQPELKAQLLRYAARLCGGNREQAKEYYQQALLDGHDWIQSRGFVGTREADYKFYLLAVIKNHHRTTVRECLKRKIVSDIPADSDYANTSGLIKQTYAFQYFEEPILVDCVDQVQHLSEQIAKELEGHPDRVIFRLSVDGHSTRQIEELTGQANRTVARKIARLTEYLRATFQQAWAGLE